MHREACRDRKKTGNPWITRRLEVQGNLSHQDTKKIQETQELQEIQNSEAEGKIRKIWSHHYHIPPDCVPDKNKVLSIVRQTYGRSPADDLNDLDVNSAIWVIFMSVTPQAAVHLGQDHTGNLQSIKHQPLKSARQLFRTTERLITDQTEITRLTTIDWNQPMWKETTLLCDRAVQFWIPKPSSFPTQCSVWETSVTNQSKPGKTGLNGSWKHAISIESTGCQWSLSGKISQHSLNWEFSTRFKRWWRNQGVNQSNSKEGSSSCQCTMTLYGENEETKRRVLRIVSKLRSMLEVSRKDIGRFWGLDPKRNGMEPILTNRMENGMKLLKAWCSTWLKADILYFVPSVLWKEENWEAKEKERHLFTSTVVMKPLNWFFALWFLSISLSIYGAVADLCKEVARDSPSAGKTAENENLESMVVPTEFPDVHTISQSDVDVQENLLREHEEKFAEPPEHQKVTKLCSDAGFLKNIGKG